MSHFINISRNHSRRGLPLPFICSALYLAVIATLPVVASGAVNISAEENKSDRPSTPANKKTAVRFDTNFLKSFGDEVDLSDFDNDISVTEGVHRTKVTINDSVFGTQSIAFKKNPATGLIEACIAVELINKANVVPERMLRPLQPTQCAFIQDVIEGATAEYDAGEQSLALSIPQAYLANPARGYVSPERWDEGVPAAAFTYGFSASTMKSDGQSDQQYYFGSLHSSFSAGAWRLHADGNFTAGTDQQTRWEHSSAYAERAISAVQARVMFGDLNTSGQMFDTSAVRGVNLATDDRMVPESQRGYAPVVRGVARTNALVTIKQGGNTLYQTSVPPGEFVINDLYATGYGGDIDVNVKESDGSEQNYSLPYSSLPQLLRMGYSKFSATLGEIRDETLTDKPMLFEGSYQKGVTNDVTLYTGVQFTAPQDYAAVLGGIAVNTPVGALGFDLTKSYSFFGRECYPACKTLSGRSARISLGKLFEQTGTYFSLMGYRYSSAGFYSLNESLQLKEAYRSNDMSRAPINMRDRFEINVSQTLGEHGGSLYATGYYGRRWQDNGRNMSLQTGYSNSWGSARYTLSASRTEDVNGKPQNGVFASLAVPLGSGSVNQPTLQLTLGHTGGETDARASITGSAGAEHQYDYSTWFDNSSQTHSSFGGGVGYSGTAGRASVGYSQSASSKTASFNAGGGVVVHSGGVNLTQQLGDTIGIINAQGATGARVLPDVNTRVGQNGYAILTSMTPYQVNSVELNLKGADMGVQVESTREDIVPTAGAAVSINFKSHKTRIAIVRVRTPDGKALPFGALVKDDQNALVGATGQGGQLFISDFNEALHLRASWGRGAKESCELDMTPMLKHETTHSITTELQEVSCNFSDPVKATTALPKKSDEVTAP